MKPRCVAPRLRQISGSIEAQHAPPAAARPVEPPTRRLTGGKFWRETPSLTCQAHRGAPGNTHKGTNQRAKGRSRGDGGRRRRRRVARRRRHVPSQDMTVERMLRHQFIPQEQCAGSDGVSRPAEPGGRNVSDARRHGAWPGSTGTASGWMGWVLPQRMHCWVCVPACAPPPPSPLPCPPSPWPCALGRESPCAAPHAGRLGRLQPTF